MSTTTTARRIALLGTSSLGLAAIVSAASLGAALAPTAAAAQTVTCTAGVTPLAGPAVVIPAGTHNPGITCAYVGDGATVSTAGNITVSSTAPANPALNGVNLSATGTDDINWVSTAGNVTGSTQINGPVIEARTAGGNINLTTANVTSTAATATHGIYAESSGAGDLTMSVGSVGAASPGGVGIEAISHGGDIAISTNGSVGSAAGSYDAPILRYGIVAETSGTGAVTLDVNSLVTGSGHEGAAISLTNGTGQVFIDATGSFAGAIRGGIIGNGNQLNTASAIVIDSAGHVRIDSNRLIMGAINPGARPAAIVVDAASFELNFVGDATTQENDFQNYVSLGGSLGSGRSSIGSTFVPALQEGAVNSGGHVDFSGVTGGATMNFETRSRWMVSDVSVLSPGADVVTFDATSILMTVSTGDGANAGSIRGTGHAKLAADVNQVLIPAGIIDFGGGADALQNLGRIFIGPAQAGNTTPAAGPAARDTQVGMRGELRLLNLETFVNAGDVWLGAYFPRTTELWGTDRWADDMLYMPGAAFHGEAGSRILMDVNLNASQSSCAPEIRDENGWLPAADCVGIQGGSATGRTELVIFELVPGDRGSYSPDGIVLVDLAGSDPADTDPDAFFLSPTVAGYTDAIGAGAIDKGLFFYAVGYDAEAQQFKLFGNPSSVAQQLPILATAANQLWHTATGGWFQRRVDQRDVDRDDGLGTGAWFNLTGSNSTRDITTSIPFGIASADFDNSYDQNDVALSFGWDLIGHDAAAGSFALGAMVGYAQSQIEFEGDNSANLEGVHVGAYGGYTWGGFFVDAAVNSAWLSLHNEAPVLNLTPAGTMLGTDVQSLGARIEAGWRWRSGPMWVEPIVGLSTVTTEFDEIRIPNDDPDVNRPGGVVTLDAAESRRASIGVGIGLDDLMADVAPTSLSLTARRVNEFEGASDVTIANSGPDALMSDTFDGAFTQLTGSVGVSNDRRTISGYLNVDAVKGDDYESLGVSAGMRLQW